ncbi:hypothetical protein ACSTS3_20695 [Aquimarina muelleri]|uniref:hypothetical protein n=1 Tax=Aquimarina muelleri TaxID=279356 RepID=UPI003F68829E
MKTKKITLLIISLFALSIGFSQEQDSETSNIQEYTPSKLLKKGQWDIKFFNSIYTQTEQTDAKSNPILLTDKLFLLILQRYIQE